MTNYRATHAHVEDQSTAMFLGFEDDCQTIILENEDGVAWADSAHKWNRIPGRLHAHVSTSARDCDGGHGYDYITEMNAEEIRESQQDDYDDFSDIHFKQRVLGNHIFFESEFGVTVKVDEDGFHMHERTDEGFRAAEVRWCTDDCADESSVFDEYAEAMGY